jgi:hypothetical protein
MTAPTRLLASTRVVASSSLLLILATALALAVAPGLALASGGIGAAPDAFAQAASTPGVPCTYYDGQDQLQHNNDACPPDRRGPNADRDLLRRYPDKAHYDQARNAALDRVNDEIRRTRARLADLKVEQKLLAENDTYPNKPFPPKLRAAIDANDASIQTMKGVIAYWEDEAVRVAKLYDAELLRLRVLWGQR